jgi:hypothetical protein
LIVSVTRKGILRHFQRAKNSAAEAAPADMDCSGFSREQRLRRLRPRSFGKLPFQALTDLVELQIAAGARR